MDRHFKTKRADRLPEDVRGEAEVLSRDEELAELRLSYEDAKAGRTCSAREVLKDMAIRHNLPLEPDE